MKKAKSYIPFTIRSEIISINKKKLKKYSIRNISIHSYRKNKNKEIQYRKYIYFNT